MLSAELPEVVDDALCEGDFVSRVHHSRLHYPRVLQRLGGRVPIPWVECEKFPDDVFGLIADVSPVLWVERVLAQLHLGQHLGVRLAREGRVPAQQHVHDDPTRPHVRRLSVVTQQHLRSHVIRRAGFGASRLSVFELAREAEVDDLQRAVGLLAHEQKILGLQVSVHDAVRMAVGERREDLLHDPRRVPLGELLLLDDAIKQLTTRTQLHDDVDVSGILEGLVQLDDVRMIQRLHDIDLRPKSGEVLDVALGHRLDRPHLTRRPRRRLAHRPICAPPHLLVKDKRVRQGARVGQDEVLPVEGVLLGLI
mmetsp:Transcript_14620/g.34873  ORF Transcript_14620/g.34873 Transcript_14620/m.34873 type:complete len:309 (-) Transcript_14620:272-1198(-)